MSFLTNVRGWLLVFHLVGVVFWMGGLHVMARMLRYHAGEPPSVRESFVRLERWLQYFFVIPGALIAIGCGLVLVRNNGLHWLRVTVWLHAKLALTLVVAVIHLLLWGAQRRAASTPLNRPVLRGRWKLQQLSLFVLLVVLLALSIHHPFASGYLAPSMTTTHVASP